MAKKCQFPNQMSSKYASKKNKFKHFLFNFGYTKSSKNL